MPPEIANGSEVRLQAVLFVDGRKPLGSNVVFVTIQGRSELAGPLTRIDLQPGDDEVNYRLDAVIVNDGDAPEPGATVVIPLPRGIRAAGETPRIERRLPALEPGEASSFSVPVRLGGAVELPLQIRDAWIGYDDGRRASIASGAGVVPELLAPHPTIALERDGRRVDVRLQIANPNWCALVDLAVELSWPRALRFADGSLNVDGRSPLRAGTRAAAATLKSSPAAAQVTIARVGPRSTCELTFSGYAPAGETGVMRGSLRVGESGAAFEHALPAGRTCAPELLVVAAPEICDAGADAVVDLLAIGGDEPRTLAFTIPACVRDAFVDDAPFARDATLQLGAGIIRRIRLIVGIGDGLDDGASVELPIVARTERDECLCVEPAIVARSRAWLDTGAWFAFEGGRAQIALANRGSTCAHDLRIRAADGTSVALGSIRPGERALVPLDARTERALAREAMLETRAAKDVRLPEIRPRPARDISLLVEEPREVHEGIAFDAVWSVVAPQGAHELHVRLDAGPQIFVAPGTTTVNAHAVVDDATARVRSGIVLHDVPAGECIRFRTRCVALAPGALRLAVAARIGDDEERVAATDVHAVARNAFPQRPAGLTFFVDGDVLALEAPFAGEAAPPVEAAREPADAEVEPPSSERLRDLAAALRRDPEYGLATALPVLAALLPAGAARDAFADHLERLTVKARIPGYTATEEDYESDDARRAFDALRVARGERPLLGRLGGSEALIAWSAAIDPRLAPDLPIAEYVWAFVAAFNADEFTCREGLSQAHAALAGASRLRLAQFTGAAA